MNKQVLIQQLATWMNELLTTRRTALTAVHYAELTGKIDLLQYIIQYVAGFEEKPNEALTTEAKDVKSSRPSK